MLRRGPAQQWERLGQIDPWWGVLSAEEYRAQNLTPQALERFYATGAEHVEALLCELGVEPRTALDFGCGTGRVLVALARRCGNVVGVDVSQAMLEQCRRACEERGIDNVTLGNRIPDGPYDLVHSVLVLQHVPVRDGYRHIERLLEVLAPGGAIVLGITLQPDPITRLYYWAINVPLVANVWNVLRGRPWSYPSMQMNGYRLERVLRMLAARGARTSAVTYAPTPVAHVPDSVLVVARLPAAGPGTVD